MTSKEVAKPTRRISLAEAVLRAGPTIPEEETEYFWRKRQALESAEFLSVEDVAFLLRSSVDAVRRIPRSELPAYQGTGKSLIYLRSDLELFLRKRAKSNVPVTRDEAAGKQYASRDGNVVPFDFDAALRMLPKGR